MSIRIFKWVSSNAKGLRKVVSKLPFNQINVETLTDNKNLVITDKLNQHLNPNGNNRNITLPSTGVEEGDYFVIKNTAVYSSQYKLVIKQSTTIIDNIYSGNTKIFIYDGTNWTANISGAGSTNDNSKNTALGMSAGAYNKSTALGYLAIGTKENGFAKGNYAIVTRHGEHVAATSNTMYKKRIEMSWSGTTGDANWTQIFLDETSEQLTIVEDSAIAFDILVVAKTCIGVSPDVARYRLQGVIERVTTGDPSIPWQQTLSDYESDAAWDVRANIDTVTDSLIVEVKGSLTKIVYWHACLQTSPELICPV